jgi:host factor-I protein
MAQPGQTVQNDMWNRLRKTHCPVSIYLCNGIKLSRVVITSFDMHVITVRTGGETHLVYKSSIATVLPETKAENYRAPSIGPKIHGPAKPNSAPVVTLKRRVSKFLSDAI